MAVPLPGPGDVLLAPPDAAEVTAVARGVMTAVASATGATALQRVLVSALFSSMTGHAVDGADLEPLDAAGLAGALARRDAAYRVRIVQTMALAALVLVPLPDEVADRVSAYARELSVTDESLVLARGYAEGSLGLTLIDFERNGYRADGWAPSSADYLHTASALPDAWAFADDDPDLAARWSALAGLPGGTLGRRVWEFYAARGFTVPGLPGSAPPYLAQHDWVHVLADFGTTVESELEVFGFIARATDDPRGFALLAMVVGLFETGYVPHAAGLFDADRGHLSRTGMACRLGDAMRRGALSHPPGRGQAGGDVRFLDTDWFAVADLPVGEARRRFGIPGKDASARAAGSVGPWEPGGISPYQAAAGARAAQAAGLPYDTFGATPVANPR